MNDTSLPGIGTSVLALAIMAILAGTLRNRLRSRLPLPPGPKPFPLIGNVLDMPKGKEWQTFEKWYHQYGDVVHVSLIDRHMVILNSIKAVSDLLEHRSTVYSSRPQSIMAHGLMGFGAWNFSAQEYGDKWRQNRRLFHSGVHQGVVSKYQSVQIRNVRAFLKRLQESSDDFFPLVRKYVGSTIIDVVYGIENEKKDYLTSIADEGQRLFGRATKPGTFMVDLIPALRFVPRWFPGASFHKIAERTRYLTEEMRQAPMQEVKKAMFAGSAKSCMTTQLLEDAEDGTSGASESDVANVTGVAYGAGSDTTVASILTFVLVMCIYPEVQAKAHAELLAVVGTDRLPDFSDLTSLPYINAIVLELLRWQPVANFGLPRCTTADDEYQGYLIPKGTVVLANIWSILHNPEEYPEPEEFRPERFLKRTHDGKYELNKAVRNPQTVVFGFGRRICPGRHLAEQTLFAVMASIIATFSITPKIDKFGIPHPPKVDMSGGLVSRPLPFDCTIKPRSARAVELIDQPLPERGLEN